MKLPLGDALQFAPEQLSTYVTEDTENNSAVLSLLISKAKGQNWQNSYSGERHNCKMLQHIAAQCNNLKILKLLLDNDAIVDAVDPISGFTPLAFAVQEQHVEIVQLLLMHKANPNTNILQGQSTILALNIQTGNLEILELLLKNGLQLPKPRLFSPLVNWLYAIKKHNTPAFSPLHFAIESNQLIIFNKLIEAGADLELQTGQSGTALCYALKHNKLEFAKSLLESRANMYAVSDSYLSVIEYTSTNEAVSLLVEYGFDTEYRNQAICNNRYFNQFSPTPLISAVKAGNLQLCIALLANQANPNALQGNLSPLTIAFKQQFQSIALNLIKHGANIRQNIDGLNLLEYAIINDFSCSIIIELFLKTIKIDLEMQELKFFMELLINLESAQKSTSVELLEICFAVYQIDTNAATKGTILLQLLEKKSCNISITAARIALLLDKQPNKTNQLGETALYVLIYRHAAHDNNSQDNNLLALAQEVINSGADINQADNHGITPLHLALLMQDYAGSIFLIRNGANLISFIDSHKNELNKVIEYFYKNNANMPEEHIQQFVAAILKTGFTDQIRLVEHTNKNNQQQPANLEISNTAQDHAVPKRRVFSWRKQKI